VLTLKTPVQGEFRHKVRNEDETTVGDAGATAQLLHNLGFTPYWRYQKYRTVYTLGDLAICLDETPIGCFVELEGPPEQIDAAAERLGFTPDQYVRETYRTLHERDAQRRGDPIGDLLLVPAPDPSS
jgi:adenylate cyclase class 2